MLQEFGKGLVVSGVDFIMVFLVLGGLAWAVKCLEKFVAYLELPHAAKTPALPVPAEVSEAVPAQPINVAEHLAVITAALCAHTGLTPGAFTIDAVRPLGAQPVDATAHLAALTAALSAHTGLTPGAFTINYVMPLGGVLTAQALESPDMVSEAQVAAIIAAIQDFSGAPVNALSVTEITPVGRADTWKLAGRIELMNNRG